MSKHNRHVAAAIVVFILVVFPLALVAGLYSNRPSKTPDAIDDPYGSPLPAPQPEPQQPRTPPNATTLWYVLVLITFDDDRTYWQRTNATTYSTLQECQAHGDGVAGFNLALFGPKGGRSVEWHCKIIKINCVTDEDWCPNKYMRPFDIRHRSDLDEPATAPPAASPR
jgi:hypothetical protein